MSGDLDRIKAGLTSFVKGLLAPLPYYARYQARVIAQNSDGTLELVPDDAKIPGLSRVPIYSGIAGVALKVPAGSRCLLEFAGANPERPIVTGWEPGTALQVTLDAAIVQVAGSIEAAVKGTSYVTAEATFLAALAAYAAAIKGVADPSNAATPALLAAITAFETAGVGALSAKVRVG